LSEHKSDETVHAEQAGACIPLDERRAQQVCRSRTLALDLCKGQGEGACDGQRMVWLEVTTPGKEPLPVMPIEGQVVKQTATMIFDIRGSLIYLRAQPAYASTIVVAPSRNQDTLYYLHEHLVNVRGFLIKPFLWQDLLHVVLRSLHVSKTR
jgi:hypothetical protein